MSEERIRGEGERWMLQNGDIRDAPVPTVLAVTKQERDFTLEARVDQSHPPMHLPKQFVQRRQRRVWCRKWHIICWQALLHHLRLTPDWGEGRNHWSLHLIKVKKQEHVPTNKQTWLVSRLCSHFRSWSLDVELGKRALGPCDPILPLKIVCFYSSFLFREQGN